MKLIHHYVLFLAGEKSKDIMEKKWPFVLMYKTRTGTQYF
jgi:hypothetical protein